LCFILLPTNFKHAEILLFVFELKQARNTVKLLISQKSTGKRKKKNTGLKMTLTDDWSMACKAGWVTKSTGNTSLAFAGPSGGGRDGCPSSGRPIHQLW
jgi:hypothetical protein